MPVLGCDVRIPKQAVQNEHRQPRDVTVVFQRHQFAVYRLKRNPSPSQGCAVSPGHRMQRGGTDDAGLRTGKALIPLGETGMFAQALWDEHVCSLQFLVHSSSQ